jgi:oxygen-independent coproporphyrinogen-3 oxidase
MLASPEVSTAMFQFAALPPLSLYMHFPWCVRKCPYCDFNSHALRPGPGQAVRGEIPEAQYIDALLADLEADLPRVWGRPVRSIFLGGGTPSLFSPEAIEQLLAGIRARVALIPEAEVTLEANPGTVETERFRGYRAAGVNRLSIGIQSFNPEQLQKLGRIHGRDEALAAAQAARAAGFDNFNLDLMFGLPQQTLDEALADVRTALALQPAHLSVYQLTLEPNTLFHAQPPALPDDDEIAAMQEALQAELAAADFVQYEVSAYARAGQEPKCRDAHGCASVAGDTTPGATEAHGRARAAAGRRCRHNLNYWQFGDYLGIGAGAHAKITDAEGVTRLWKVKQPRDYLATAGTPAGLGGKQRPGRDDVAFEFMLNALRLTEGVPAMLFSERTGLDPSCLQKPLTQARARGLLEPGHEHFRPTPLGRRFLNELVALFLPEATRKDAQVPRDDCMDARLHGRRR